MRNKVFSQVIEGLNKCEFLQLRIGLKTIDFLFKITNLMSLRLAFTEYLRIYLLKKTLMFDNL